MYPAVSPSASQALSVSEALASVKSSLESLPMRIIGEVSEVSNKPGYKAVYFSVKDSSASLSCMMWNNRYRLQGVRLAVGQLIELEGRFTVYAAKGRMNFDVSSIRLAGEGRLRMQVAALARKLESEGLMDASRKRPLPAFPACIGLVTSPRGAAVHDVLRTLRRRYPSARVLLAGVPVEGNQASAGLREGIRCVTEAGAQLVLLVRGGGSFEDLMPFNDEALARAIAACPVPLVTGIGHEPDTTIADMVSDCRASTPTAAAELASSSAAHLPEHLLVKRRALSNALCRTLERNEALVYRSLHRPLFQDGNYLLSREAQMLDYASDRLFRSLPSSLDRYRSLLDSYEKRLSRSLPLLFRSNGMRLVSYRERLRAIGFRMTEPSKGAISLQASRLHDLSPLQVLARGYALVNDSEGHVVTKAEQMHLGMPVSIRMADGNVDCRVEGIRSNEKSKDIEAQPFSKEEEHV